MIPCFHAAGHLAYAKYAHFYLQQMSQLKEYIPDSEYEHFTKKVVSLSGALQSFGHIYGAI